MFCAYNLWAGLYCDKATVTWDSASTFSSNEPLVLIALYDKHRVKSAYSFLIPLETLKNTLYVLAFYHFMQRENWASFGPQSSKLDSGKDWHVFNEE